MRYEAPGMVGSRAAAHLDRGRPDWTVMDRLGKAWESVSQRRKRVSQRSVGIPRALQPLGMGTQNVTREACVGGGG